MVCTKHQPIAFETAIFGTGGGCLKDLYTTYTMCSVQSEVLSRWHVSPPFFSFLHPYVPWTSWTFVDGSCSHAASMHAHLLENKPCEIPGSCWLGYATPKNINTCVNSVGGAFVLVDQTGLQHGRSVRFWGDVDDHHV